MLIAELIKIVEISRGRVYHASHINAETDIGHGVAVDFGVCPVDGVNRNARDIHHLVVVNRDVAVGLSDYSVVTAYGSEFVLESIVVNVNILARRFVVLGEIRHRRGRVYVNLERLPSAAVRYSVDRLRIVKIVIIKLDWEMLLVKLL